MGEAGSFLMELLKIASINQIRSIKILSVSVADSRKTDDSNVKTQTPPLKYKTEGKKTPMRQQCPLLVKIIVRCYCGSAKSRHVNPQQILKSRE